MTRFRTTALPTRRPTTKPTRADPQPRPSPTTVTPPLRRLTPSRNTRSKQAERLKLAYTSYHRRVRAPARVSGRRPRTGPAPQDSSSSSLSMAMGQAGLRGQPATSFPAASLQDGSSRSGSRPAAKPVLTLPAAVVGLVSALHGGFFHSETQGVGATSAGRRSRPVRSLATLRGRAATTNTTALPSDLQRCERPRPRITVWRLARRRVPAASARAATVLTASEREENSCGVKSPPYADQWT